MGALKFLYHTKFGGAVLKLLTCRFVSSIAGAFLDSRLSVPRIKGYVKKNGIDLSLYEEKKYRSFNDFFTRKIRPELRPFDVAPDALVAPCDGKLTVYPIDDELIFNVKGFDYSVSTLLKNEELAKEFSGGYCLVFRLCVEDYHRYFYFDTCKKSENVPIKGRYHTVQPIALGARRVFNENHREYTVMETENFQKAVQVEVGAMMVGRIVNNHGEGNFSRGEEKGKFEFGGSTIILLLQKDVAKIDEELIKNTENDDETIVRCGERIGVKA